ncbi:hypothetical protein BDA99DRAFT_608205 [Phascolomyces articulosus]|uniref:F-box domain-containing protein n=1 Tax=Phascolomyces articulosus TaxID=60185 RepID=A0AAD5K4Q2_9FUNG|nr:hypothetical protein BDA99DRAFT_608205 [Phascolomyces articulosus]
MTDFTTILPIETLCDVFSYLDQNDSLECMNVSHAWYNSIPNYTRPVWRELKITPTSWNKPPTQSILKCLGPHVKKVIIHSQDTCRILDTLDRRKCRIKSLDICGHKVMLKRKGRPAANDSIKLPMTIGMFANTLTELLMDGHPCDISVPMILDTLPALMHLSVKFNDIERDTLSNTEIGGQHPRKSKKRALAKTTAQHTNLIFLCLDNALNFDTRILPILHRCPNLKFLLVALDMDRTHVYDVQARYIRDAFRLCPLVRYIAWNGDPEKDRVEEWLELSRKEEQRRQRLHLHHNSSIYPCIHNEENDDGMDDMIDKEEPGTVRKIVFACNNSQDMDHLVPIMIKSRPWLEHLYISVVYDWFWDFLPRYHFPQLTTLELYGIAMTSELWRQVVLYHPNIEHLETEIYVEEMVDLDRIIESMGSTLTRLRHLLLQYERSNPFTAVTCTTLGALISTNIQHLHLASVSISDQAFYDICGLPQLQELCVGAFDTYRSFLSEDGLLAGVKRWVDGYKQEVEDENGKKSTITSKYKIRFIQLTAIQCVTDAVLELLGQVDSLITLRITYNESITNEGPKAFCHGNNNGNQKKLETYACYGISRSNPFATRLPD